MQNLHNDEDLKRDLAVRIIRRLGYNADGTFRNQTMATAIDSVVQSLDEFLPKDESDKQ